MIVERRMDIALVLFNIRKFAGPLWVVLVIFSLFLFSILTPESYLKMDALMIWGLSCITILYLLRNNHTPFIQLQKKNALTLVGILLCVFSFVNIPLGFGNPPYSIGDFSILLSGLGLVFFTLLGLESPLLPVSFPAIAVIGFQLYELFVRNETWLVAPFIPYTVSLALLIVHLMGIPAVSSGNIITFTSLTGDPIYLSIVADCVGIWSLGTFSVTALLVFSSFQEARTKKALPLLLIGYIGTYTTNILRISIIALSGYLYGPTGIIESVHIHIGWILFSLWLIVFWYYFFTRHLGFSFRDMILQKKTAPR